jgi:hypothetical protein
LAELIGVEFSKNSPFSSLYAFGFLPVWACLSTSTIRKERAEVTIPRHERLRITQQVYSEWSEIYDDRKDAEAEEAYANMFANAMAEAEEKYKDRPANT